MKTWRYTIILLMTICLLLSACVAKNSDITHQGNMQQDIQTDTEENPAEDNVSTASNLLPEQDTVQEVFVCFSGNTYVGTTEEEKTAILNTLYATDLGGFVNTEQSGIFGASISLKFHTSDDEIYIDIITDHDAQYLRIKNTQQQPFKKGPADAIDSRKLNQLVSDVLSNEADPNYSGKVTVAGSDFVHSINKANAAFVKNILDKASASATVTGNADDLLYNITLEIGNTIYGINSDTGCFFMQEAGEKTYAQIADQLLTEIKTRIGVLNATE